MHGHLSVKLVLQCLDVGDMFVIYSKMLSGLQQRLLGSTYTSVSMSHSSSSRNRRKYFDKSF